MSRIKVGYLNIAMPSPHGPDRYFELLRSVIELRESVALRADFHGMLGSVHRDGALVTGQVYKFFNLDLNESWFNIQQQKKAESEELAQITVPNYLKPHLRTIEYAFFPKKHRLAFMVKDGANTISPTMAKKLFDGLFSFESIQEKFGEIAVTIEPVSGLVEKILKMASLHRLRMEITPPNPDDLESEEEEVKKRLQEINARSMVVEFSAPRSQKLKPDEEAKTLARIAASNGKVTGMGRDAEGNQTELSTTSMPLIEEEFVSNNVESSRDAFINVASQRISDF